MMKMTKTILARIWWLGRGTATVMGLAVMLALTVGLASTALAGTGVGSRFDLGKTNTVNAISRLVGSVGGPSLTIDNNSTASGATALDLQVEPGKPPMRVNSTVEVQGLNVDSIDGKNSSEFLLEDQTAADAAKLDGKDSTAFFSGEVYAEENLVSGPGFGDIGQATAQCDAGDVLLGGGGGGSVGNTDDKDDELLRSEPQFNLRDWRVVVRDNGLPTPITVRILCADFPPLRP